MDTLFKLYRYLLFITAFIISVSGISQQSKPFLLKLDSTYRGTLQWEQSSDRNTWTELPGGGVPSLQVQPTNTTYYRAKVSEHGCSPVYSGEKAVFVDGNVTVGGKIITGKINLPVGSVINVTDLNVLSYLGEVHPNNDGSFEVLLEDSASENVLLVTNKNEEVVMLGHYVQPQREYIISAESSAMAMLIMHPFLKPVPVADKSSFANLYKSEPEFQQLVNQVAVLNKQGLNLFSNKNTDIIAKVKGLVTANFNKDRLRVGQSQKLAVDLINIFSSGTGSVTISSSATFGYNIRIYEKNGTAITSGNEIIPGSLIRESPLALEIFKYLIKLDQFGTRNNNKLDELEYDLKKDLGLLPGEYVVKVINGLANDLTKEDDLALYHNQYEIISLIFSNIASATFMVKDECLKNLIDALLKVFPPEKVRDAAKKGGVAFSNEIIFPFFLELGKAVENISNANCIVTTNKLLKKILKIVDIVDKLTPIVWFAAEWHLSPNTIKGCQLLDNNYKTSNCFVFEKLTTIKEAYYSCDTVEVKVRAVEDKDYYPHKGELVPFREFEWRTGGRSRLASTGATSAQGQTNLNGEASIKWIMSGEEQEDSLRAFLLLHNNEILPKAVFKTRTYKPQAYTIPSGDNKQIGTPGSPLPKPLTITIKDRLDNLPMKMERFKIEWKVVKGSGNISVTTSLSPFDSNFIWTLGPEQGEQIVEATVAYKDAACSNIEIEGSKITFTANEIYEKWFIRGYEELTFVDNILISKKTEEAKDGEYLLFKNDMTYDYFDPSTGICEGTFQLIDVNGIIEFIQMNGCGLDNTYEIETHTDQKFELYRREGTGTTFKEYYYYLYR